MVGSYNSRPPPTPWRRLRAALVTILGEREKVLFCPYGLTMVCLVIADWRIGSLSEMWWVVVVVVVVMLMLYSYGGIGRGGGDIWTLSRDPDNHFVRISIPVHIYIYIFITRLYD